jgi:hypothetical protein
VFLDILFFMNKIILGFDISSNTIGYCVLSVDLSTKHITFIKSGFVKPTKKGNIVERLANTRKAITDIIENVKPDYIGIEDLIKFMPKSTATAVVMLTTFNRMICLTCYDYLKKSPALFNVMSIRHGIKKDKILPKKEDIPELVAYHLNIKFPYITTTRSKAKNSIKSESYDVADGCAVALYYAFILIGKIKGKIT